MRILKKLTSLLILLTCVSTLTCTYAATPGQQLQQQLNKIGSFKANFTEKLYRGNKLLNQSKGLMLIQRPGRFRWEVKSPQPLLIISNGKKLWIYNEALRQVTIANAKQAMGNTPASLLSSRTRLLTNYFITHYHQGWYYMRPRYSGSNIQQIRLKFNGNRFSQMVLVDQLGQRSDIQFSEMKLNSRINKNLFQFTIPKGVDIISS